MTPRRWAVSSGSIAACYHAQQCVEKWIKTIAVRIIGALRALMAPS